MDLGTLHVTLGAPMGPLAKDLKQAQTAMGRYVQRTKTQLRAVGSAVFSLRGAVIAMGGAFAAKKFIDSADALTLVEGRLKLVTASAKELTQVQKDLLAVSNETRNSYQSTADLYARVARSTRDLNISSQRLLKTTETINKALIVSGASATEANAALIQLSQGFASGELRGEELRSVMEQTPRLARAMADGLGVTIGKLREMGHAGELSTLKIMNALESQGPVIQHEFAQMPKTVGQALVVMGNDINQAIFTFSKLTGTSQAFVDMIYSMTEAIRTLSTPEVMGEFLKTIKELWSLFSVIPVGVFDFFQTLMKWFDRIGKEHEKMAETMSEVEKEVTAANERMDADVRRSWDDVKEFFTLWGENIIKIFQFTLKAMGSLFASVVSITIDTVKLLAQEWDALAKIIWSALTFDLAGIKTHWNKLLVDMTAFNAKLALNWKVTADEIAAARDDIFGGPKGPNVYTGKVPPMPPAANPKVIKAATVEMKSLLAAYDTLREENKVFGFDTEETEKALDEMRWMGTLYQNDLTEMDRIALEERHKNWVKFNQTVTDEAKTFFVDSFDNIGDAWEELVERMKDKFLGMLFDILLESATKKIVIPVVVDLLGGLGGIGTSLLGQIGVSDGVGGLGPGQIQSFSNALSGVPIVGNALSSTLGALNAPLYGGDPSGFLGGGVTGLGLAAAGFSAYNAYGSFQNEDYGRAAYQGANAAAWAIPGMQPVAALMSIGDMLGLDDIFSNIGSWVADRFNDDPTVRGKYGVGLPADFDILSNPDIRVAAKLNYDDRWQTGLQDDIDAALDASIGETLKAISNNLQVFIDEGVLTPEDIPADWLESTLAEMNVSLGTKEYPNIFKKNLEANLEKWHTALIEESEAFLTQLEEDVISKRRLEFQRLSQFAGVSARIDALRQQDSPLADLRTSFKNMEMAFLSLDQSAESYYDDSLMILSTQTSVLEEINSLTQQQIAQLDKSVEGIDRFRDDLKFDAGLAPVMSLEVMENRFAELIDQISPAATPEEAAAATSELLSFLPQFIDFQKAFGGDYATFIADLDSDLAGVRGQLVDSQEEAADRLTQAFDTLEDSVTRVTDAILGLGDATEEDSDGLPIANVTLAINLGEDVITTMIQDILNRDEETIEILRDQIPDYGPYGGPFNM